MDANASSWHEQRMTGIGGSDVAAILGLSKWNTPRGVWEQKVGIAQPVEDNPAMFWGRTLEPVVRQHYSDQTGREVRIPTDLLRSPQYTFMIANVDGVTADRRIVEIKTARDGRDWGEPGTDEIPIYYICQVQHYMAVTGFDVADVAVLIGGSDFRLYEIHADVEFQSLMVEKEAEFWECVTSKAPPAPVSYQDMLAAFKTSKSVEVVASGEIRSYVHRLKVLSAQIKQMEEEHEACKAAIMGAMGEADTLVAPDGKPLVTWKSSKPRESFDSKAFQAAHPELYPQFIKTGEASRRFLVK